MQVDSTISVTGNSNFIEDNLKEIKALNEEPASKIQGRLIYKLQDRYDNQGPSISVDNKIIFKNTQTLMVGKQIEITIKERLGFPFCWFGREETLKTTTDQNGRFSITFPHQYKGACDVIVKLFSRINPLSKTENGTREIASFMLNLKENPSGHSIDIGTQQVHHLPFRDQDLPRASYPEGTVFPTEPSFSYQWRLFTAVIREQMTTLMKDIGIPCFTPNNHEDINKIFNIVDPNFKIDENEVIDMVFNRTGQAPARKTENPNILAFHYEMSKYDREDPKQGGPLCPDLILYCNKTDKGITSLHSIKVMHEGKEYIKTPDDGQEWTNAMRLLLSMAAVRGQFHNHLVLHLWTEGVYMSALRTLDKSPIKQLIYAFCKDLPWINREGEKEIFMNQGVLGQSPLTEQGILESQYDAFGWTDWKNWKPRKPLGPKDDFAIAQQYFWENFCTPHIDRFIDENMESIQQNASELYNFSKELVKISYPATGMDKVEDEGEFDDTSELLKNADNASRLSQNGILKATTPILTHKGSLNKEDIENLKQFFRYLYMQVTLRHDNFHRNLRMDLARGCGVLAPYNLGETEYLDTPIHRYWHQIDITSRLTSIGYSEDESETATVNYHDILPEYFVAAFRNPEHIAKMKEKGTNLTTMLRSVIF